MSEYERRKEYSVLNSLLSPCTQDILWIADNGIIISSLANNLPVL